MGLYLGHQSCIIPYMIDAFWIALLGVIASVCLLLRYQHTKELRELTILIPVLYATGIYLVEELVGIDMLLRQALIRWAFVIWFGIKIIQFFADVYYDKYVKKLKGG